MVERGFVRAYHIEIRRATTACCGGIPRSTPAYHIEIRRATTAGFVSGLGEVIAYHIEIRRATTAIPCRQVPADEPITLKSGGQPRLRGRRLEVQRVKVKPAAE